MNLDADALVSAFEAGRRGPAAFHHREHVAVAFALLRRHPFLDAVIRYADGLRGLAGRAGAPEKFNVTVTVAFLSLIAERMAECPDATFDGFLRDDHRARSHYPSNRAAHVAHRRPGTALRITNYESPMTGP